MSQRLQEHIKQSVPFESEAQAALLNLFVASSFMRDKIESVCVKRNISFTHYNVLRILNGAPEEGYSRGDLSERMIERASDVTRLMDRLEKIGLVDRERSELDRRIALHRITEKGRKLLDEMHADIVDLQEFFRSRVAPRDLAHLSRICEGIYLGFE